jgi:hypothetical protein
MQSAPCSSGIRFRRRRPDAPTGVDGPSASPPAVPWRSSLRLLDLRMLASTALEPSSAEVNLPPILQMRRSSWKVHHKGHQASHEGHEKSGTLSRSMPARADLGSRRTPQGSRATAGLVRRTAPDPLWPLWLPLCPL